MLSITQKVCSATIMVSLISSVLVVSLPGSACSAEAEPIRVVVSVQPQAYFVERVGGEYVDVEVLVGPGRSPATYEPTPQQMVRLQQADLYFSIGVPFESGLMPKVQGLHSDLRLVDMSNGIEDSSPVDQHEPHAGHGHDHGGVDPHVWLDPAKVKIMARTISQELSQLHPKRESWFQDNLQLFLSDLDSVDMRIRRRLSDVQGKTFFVFHPAYGHFARAYGLNQVAVEVDGKEPGPAQLADVIKHAKRDKVDVIIVQPQFAQKSAETIAAAIGSEILSLDPLAREYLTNLEEMADKLARVLGGVSTGDVGLK